MKKILYLLPLILWGIIMIYLSDFIGVFWAVIIFIAVPLLILFALISWYLYLWFKFAQEMDENY